MRVGALQGVIRRRVLVNFRVDPALIQRELPPPFQPKLVAGWAIAGVCLIRLEQLRPKGLPACLGLSGEHAAHRIAVSWTDASRGLRDGVFIRRRDTASRLTAFLGGRLVPGEHQRAQFRVQENATCIDLRVSTPDGAGDVRMRGTSAESLPSSSCFASLQAASAFFAAGSIGYSPTRGASGVEGLELRTTAWRIEPLQVVSVFCGYFADTDRFPPGSVAFDSVLVMRNLAHEWHPVLESPACTCCAHDGRSAAR